VSVVLPRGRIKDAPEDFVVEELPLYEASGSGDHLFVRFTKRGLTTFDVVEALASTARVPSRDVGVAGLKDKVGVTTQTVSLPVPRGVADFEAKVLALSLPGVVIHEVRRHPHKLKPGHLAGNRFTIALRGLDPSRVGEVIATLERAGRDGIPNAFGAQRFGRDRDNAEQALLWLTGKRPGPKDPRKRRFLWSALQSSLFNDVLDRRVAEGTWRTPLLGDVLKKTDSGGLFDCTDETIDRARAERGEVSPTGPMFGAKMREPSGKPQELERAVFVGRLGESFDLASTKPFGEGTRRGLCLGIQGMSVARTTVERSMNREGYKGAVPKEQEAAVTVCFVLPKGSYATSVLGAAVDLEPDFHTSKPGESRPTDTTHNDKEALREGERDTETELE